MQIDLAAQDRREIAGQVFHAKRVAAELIGVFDCPAFADGVVKADGKFERGTVADGVVHADYKRNVRGNRLSLRFGIAGVQHHALNRRGFCGQAEEFRERVRADEMRHARVIFQQNAFGLAMPGKMDDLRLGLQ